MPRPLPSQREAIAILATKRTRRIHWTPPAAGRALVGTLKALEARFGKGAEGLEARWRDIVGETLARRSEPVRLIRSRSGPAALELRVDGPAAAIIQHQSAEILARVNLFLGPATVARLRVTQGPLRHTEAERRTPRGRPHIGAPLDAGAERALSDSLASLREGPLRDALIRLGRAVLRKG